MKVVEREAEAAGRGSFRPARGWAAAFGDALVEKCSASCATWRSQVFDPLACITCLYPNERGLFDPEAPPIRLLSIASRPVPWTALRVGEARYCKWRE